MEDAIIGDLLPSWDGAHAIDELFRSQSRPTFVFIFDFLDSLTVYLDISEGDRDLHFESLCATELIQVDLRDVGDDLLILSGLLA